jgi:hypothetical protein
MSGIEEVGLPNEILEEVAALIRSEVRGQATLVWYPDGNVTAVELRDVSYESREARS